MKIHATEDFAHVVVLDQPAAYGQEFDVDDDVAAVLLEQDGWAKKAPPKRKPATDEPDPLFARHMSAPVVVEGADGVSAGNAEDDAPAAAPTEEQ